MKASRISAAAAPVAVLAGSGELPVLACGAISRSGREPVVFAIAGEADPAAFQGYSVYPLRLGEVGRLWSLIAEHKCRDAVLIGAVSHRPDLSTIRLDFGALLLVPRVLKLMRSGDDSLFSGIARIFEEKGINLLSVLDVAPELALPPGVMTRRRPRKAELEEIAKGREAVRALGALDIGQAAIAVGGRVVAVEGAEGTDGLMARLGALRASKRIPAEGGVLVKGVKPDQERRIDLPTVGPQTARNARAAGLTGVAAEAGDTLLVGREQTVEAFDREGLFLFGIEGAVPGA